MRFILMFIKRNSKVKKTWVVKLLSKPVCSIWRVKVMYCK